jgi:formylglycine-generating enzyme required for sulfatase activity
MDMKWPHFLVRPKKEGCGGNVSKAFNIPAGCFQDPSCHREEGAPGFTVIHKLTGMKFVWVPGTKGMTGKGIEGDSFLMGSTLAEIDKQWQENGWLWSRFDYPELPKHPVMLSEFWLAAYQVTNEVYSRFIRSSAYKAAQWEMYSSSAPTNLPAVFLSRKDAVEFCKWAGFALPTEAQWEWAARGPNGSIYPWGDEWDKSKCNSIEFYLGPAPSGDHLNQKMRELTRDLSPGNRDKFWNEFTITHLSTPGRFEKDKSWCGAFDMAGNVQEWCRDYYDSEYYKASPATNPIGPQEGGSYSVRGGCWSKVAHFCRSTNRGMDDSTGVGKERGFRPCIETK